MTAAWRLKYWNGSAWANAELRSWDGSAWQLKNGWYWDGSAWQIITDRTPPTSTHVADFGQHDAGSYAGTNARRTDSNGLSQCYQGYNTSTWGIQRSMWMTDITMQSVLTGFVSVNYVHFIITNLFTYYNAGGTAAFGTHAVNSTSPPGTFSQSRYGVVVDGFARGQNKTVPFQNDWAYWAVDGSFRGVTLFFNSTDSEYYGYYQKFPVVEISYVK